MRELKSLAAMAAQDAAMAAVLACVPTDDAAIEFSDPMA
ncbi:hypothetical protein SAMN05192568_10635 [Methylobacterium pseudosasicola]|uniref:Uncharacterized protein n=1 Tax=Methylobacterium pseudosasicola TaxID=582667 RepID=A0A1I4U427_9HYPH|nr:hypothetical protein SAMN05192568_10635 [Methylobacterium pseudosasicola]